MNSQNIFYEEIQILMHLCSFIIKSPLYLLLWIKCRKLVRQVVFGLFIYLSKNKVLWNKTNPHSKLSKNFLTYSIICCFTEVKIFSFEAAMEQL